MPPPSPTPPPQPRPRSSMPLLILALVVAIGILAYTQGWISFNKDKFKTDKDAFTQKVKDAVASGKAKLNDLKGKQQNATDEEKAKVQKEIDETTKAINDLEASGKEVEKTDDEKKLQELQDRLNRLLEKNKANPKKDNP